MRLEETRFARRRQQVISGRFSALLMHFPGGGLKILSQSFAELEHSGWRDPKTAQACAKDFARVADYSVPVTLEGAQAGPGDMLLDLC